MNIGIHPDPEPEKKAHRPKREIVLKTGGKKLTGVRKAAILLIALGTEAASIVLKHLRDEEVEQVSIEIAMLRNVIATLQDLGFVVDKADEDLGAITGTKLNGYRIRMTVVVRPRGETQLLVRANAHYNLEPIEDPRPYQDFFVALEKSLFLTAHNVD